MRDTGAIVFICPGGAGKHEEKEVEFNDCPGCGKKNYFVAFENGFHCYSCKAEFSKDKIKCDCGFVPRKGLKIKHK